MSQKCRNDCKDLILFPGELKNRPDRSHIDYRIGTYSDFREALLEMLNADPILAPWTNREADDPGIALLEGASILGDILTFYQELYANEAYLRTAQWRESIADLVHLLGYHLSPGLGGKATFAFEVKGDKPVVIPAGFPIKAQVEGMEKPVEFETKKESIAIPSLNKFNLYRPLQYPDVTNTTQKFYICYPNQFTNPVALEKGDRLLIGDPYPRDNPTRLINCEVIIVDDIQDFFSHKQFRIKGALKKRADSTNNIVGFKLGRSFRHFGHNAPQKIVVLNNYEQAKEYYISYIRWLSRTTSSIILSGWELYGDEERRIVNPDLLQLDFPLDYEVVDLVAGNQFIIQGSLFGVDSSSAIREFIQEEFTFIRNIESVRLSSMTWGAISGATTLVSIDKKLGISKNNVRYYGMDIRTVQFHEVISPLLLLCAGADETPQITGNVLNFHGTDAQVKSLKGRQLFFKDPGGKSFTAGVTIAQSLSASASELPLLRKIALDRYVNYIDFPNKNPKVTVYGNLIEATQGKTEKEAVLGNGDSRQTFQTFKLPKAPLTYHNAAGETPPEVPELQIYVNDHLWTRVPSFFGHGLKEEIYVVREDENSNSWVQFGDGKTGSRLPSGIGNAVAKYRTGTGAYGALKEGTTVQPGGKLNRLDKIQLPDVASGGCEPETGDNAREAAPGKIQSLDRLVSLRDFETEALAIAGISKATAIWGLTNNVPTINITVMMETGRYNEFKEVREILNNYNNERGPNRYPIQVNPGKRLYVYIDTAYGFHPSFREEKVEKAIKEALGVAGEEGNGIDGSRGLFGLHQRQFGQREYATRIAGTIQNVDGVEWAEVRASGLVGESDKPSELTTPVNSSLTQLFECENNQILSLYKGHLQLNGTAAGEVYKK